MMKAAAVIFLAMFLLTFSSFADTIECENLSHTYIKRGMIVDYRQVRCEKFHLTFRDLNGEPYSEDETLFSTNFHATNVDDDNEITSNQQRWMFSRDGKSIIHEAIIDSLDKNTGKKQFLSLVEIISKLNDGKIQSEATQLKRTESSTGVVAVEFNKTTEQYLPLNVF